MTRARKLRDCDRKVAEWLTVRGDARWRWLPIVGAHLGDGPLWVLIGGTIVLVGTDFVRALACIAALAVLGASLVATAVKYSVCRSRPQERARFYARYDRYSFPSGHATRMAAIAVVVGHFVPWVRPISYALALIVALCRVMVGVHYPSDVIAGLLIGFASAASVLLLVQG